MPTLFPYITVMQDTDKDASFNHYKVLDDCEVQTYDLVIPRDFVTDFASVPRVLWPLFPPYGRAMPASILHDYIYTVHPKETQLTPKVERYFADNLFYNAMIAIGISKFQATLMYYAVRWFGAGRYRKHGQSKKKVKSIK